MRTLPPPDQGLDMSHIMFAIMGIIILFVVIIENIRDTQDSHTCHTESCFQCCRGEH
jgi:hypothetical protein